MVNFVLLLVVLIALGSTVAQQDEPQQQTIQLTREMVDALLQVLSPPCKSEMEAALGAQIEISDECKYEIQRTMQSFQNSANGVGEAASQQEFEDPMNSEPAAPRQPRARAPKAEAVAPGVSPVYAIMGFVVVFFGLIAGLVAYVNSKRAGIVPVKPKKLSKKKVKL